MPEMSAANWALIRMKYERGQSQRALAREFDVSQPTISTRARKEDWKRLSDIPDMPIPPASGPIADSVTDQEVTTVALAKKLLSHIALQLQQTEMGATAIKLCADSLSQIFKIEQASSQGNATTASGVDPDLLQFLTNEQLGELARINLEMEKILDQARASKMEAESGGQVTSIRHVFNK